MFLKPGPWRAVKPVISGLDRYLKVRIIDEREGGDAFFMRKRGAVDELPGEVGLLIKNGKSEIEKVEFFLIALLQKKSVERSHGLGAAQCCGMLSPCEQVHEMRTRFDE